MSEAGLDCGDNSCEFAPKRGGMRTNGGCRCLEGLSVEQRRKVRAVIHAAGVEIERLKVEVVKAQPNWTHAEALEQRDGLIHQCVALTGRVSALTAEHNASINSISDALHRIGVADSPRLVDRIAGLGEELTRLRKAAQERDGLRAEVGRLAAELANPVRHPLDRREKCPACGRMSRVTTAGCDHCDLEDK